MRPGPKRSRCPRRSATTRSRQARSSPSKCISLPRSLSVLAALALELNNGGTAVYQGGSGTQDLIFSYTVTSGNASQQLDYKSVSALVANGAVISDVGGNAAVIQLPPPGARHPGDVESDCPGQSGERGHSGTGSSLRDRPKFRKPRERGGPPRRCADHRRAGRDSLRGRLPGAGRIEYAVGCVVSVRPVCWLPGCFGRAFGATRKPGNSWLLRVRTQRVRFVVEYRPDRSWAHR